jgi:hypothetical protein
VLSQLLNWAWISWFCYIWARRRNNVTMWPYDNATFDEVLRPPG